MAIYKAVESVTRNGDGTLTAFTGPCGGCGSPGQIPVPERGFLALAYGAAPREAIPGVPAGQAAQLMTGTCARCSRRRPSRDPLPGEFVV